METHDPQRPVIVPLHGVDEDADVARPGVIVWLADRVPDPDEAARQASTRREAMRAHPAGSARPHLRAVS